MIGFTPPAPAASSEASHRLELIEELYQRYGNTRGSVHKINYWRKKYSWLLVVGSVRGLKRLIDIVASLIALILLAPLFLLVTIAIKVTDWGPALFWQVRVGRWGQEFAFPKFRSMVMNAEKLKEQLLAQNDHGQSVTFKMKKDPR